MKKDTLSVGVIGCGYWGPNLIRNFNSLRECRLTMVCDPCQERIEHMRSLYPQVRTTRDPEKIISSPEIDALVIATPVRTHYPLARMSLESGKHTFIEKPMAESSTQCRELIGIAGEKNLTLMVGHTFIYTSEVRKIKDMVASGDLGNLYYISSRRLNLGLYQKDINVAWDLAPHDISIILFIVGKAPKAVNCQGKAHVNPNIEDITNMTLDFDNGEYATIHSSWLDPNKIREMTFVGSRKMVRYDDTQPIEKIKVYDKRVEVPPHYDTFADFQYSYHYGDMFAPYLQQVEPLKVECRHFLDCIKAGAIPDSSGYDGMRVVQILEASSLSMKSGGGRVEIADIEGLTDSLLPPGIAEQNVKNTYIAVV